MELEIKKAELIRFTREEFNKYNMNGWLFAITDFPEELKDNAGICHNEYKFIQLSNFTVKHSTIEECKNTILHEIAHSMTDTIGHGEDWIKKAELVGCVVNEGHNIDCGDEEEKFMDKDEWVDILKRITSVPHIKVKKEKDEKKKVWNGKVVSTKIIEERSGTILWEINFDNGKALFLDNINSTLNIIDGDFISFTGKNNDSLNLFFIKEIVSFDYKIISREVLKREKEIREWAKEIN